MGMIIKPSRSAMIARQDCPRLRYLNYHSGPMRTGIERKSRSLPLLTGIHIHAAHAYLLNGDPIDLVVARMKEEFTAEYHAKGIKLSGGNPDALHTFHEQMFMLEVMLRAWHYHRMPKILAEYTPLLIEKEWEWEMAPGVVQPLRLDVIMERKGDNLLHALDYKTTSYASESWMQSFEVNDQTLSYSLAIVEEFKRPFGGMLYEGLVKGAYRTDTAKSSPFCGKKIQSTPLCYGYKFDGPDGPVYTSDYTSKKGWVKVAGWDEMSAEEWFNLLIKPDPVLLTKLFVPIPPIEPVMATAQKWRRQQAYQELIFYRNLNELEAATDPVEKEILLDMYFPQNFGRCYKYGADHACSMFGICHVAGNTAELALEEGDYEVRIDHHAIEEEKVAA